MKCPERDHTGEGNLAATSKEMVLKPLDWMKSQGGVCRWRGKEPRGKPQGTLTFPGLRRAGPSLGRNGPSGHRKLRVSPQLTED